MAAEMVLLRATREEAVVFEVEDIEADERLWLRVTPGELFLDGAVFGLGDVSLFASLGLLSEPSA